MMNVISHIPSQINFVEHPNEIEKLLQKYEKVPRDLPHGRTPDRGVEHNIVLEEGTSPIQIPPYRHPKIFIDEIEKAIQEILELGLIIPISSPYASSIVLVKKKYGTLRMCIDFRALKRRPSRIDILFLGLMSYLELITFLKLTLDLVITKFE